jgi:hypothetical protein
MGWQHPGWQHRLCRCVAVIGLAGCTSAGGCAYTAYTESRTLQSQPEFKVGYRAGCNSGYHKAMRQGYQNSFQKDEHLFASDPAYKQGWIAGQADCYFEEFQDVNPPLGSL